MDDDLTLPHWFGFWSELVKASGHPLGQNPEFERGASWARCVMLSKGFPEAMKAIREMDALANASYCKTPGTYDWQKRHAGVIAAAREAQPE